MYVCTQYGLHFHLPIANPLLIRPQIFQEKVVLLLSTQVSNRNRTQNQKVNITGKGKNNTFLKKRIESHPKLKWVSTIYIYEEKVKFKIEFVTHFFGLDEFEFHSPTGPNNSRLIGRIIEKCQQELPQLERSSTMISRTYVLSRQSPCGPIPFLR